MFKRRLLQKIFNKNRRGDILTKRIDIKDYQKPEIVLIDDPAFEETGQGDSGIWTPPGQSGNPPGQSGNPPGQSGNPPGQSPGQGGNPPGQSGNK
jgi:hypothetical protein